MSEKLDVEIKQFDYFSGLYQAELELRNMVLRLPLSLNLYTEDLSPEVSQWHIGAFVHSVMVGVLLLVPLKNQQIKMRQVAVHFDFQGKHIGSLLVNFAEKLAVERGFKTMILHARQTAVPFYIKMDYEIVSDVFVEVTIPHYKMKKEL